MPDRTGTHLPSRRFTPEQVDDMLNAYGREKLVEVAARLGVGSGSVASIWKRAHDTGILPAKSRAAQRGAEAPSSRPQPSMPRIAWLDRPMPKGLR